MIVFTRRRALLFSLTAPFCAAFAGCDANPNGPTFPTVKSEKDDEDDGGSDPNAPDSKSNGGRPKKKKATAGMIGDPAA